jgi:diaminopimelate epimerase
VISFGRPFFKMSGSGNDFVAFDELALRSGEDPSWLTPEAIRALCRRGAGIGADGVMVLRGAPEAEYQLLYYNADGSRAELCGNASLCSVRLAVELGAVVAGASVRFMTDTGLMTGRMLADHPEIDLAPASELEPDRSDLVSSAPGARIGFARVGVPHLVVLCDDAEAADVGGEGRRLRHHGSLRDGANVNYVSRRADGRWRIRTYERGVEAETLACGTGSVSTALLLERWRAGGEAGTGGGATDEAGTDPGEGEGATTELRLLTSSGLEHRVRLRLGPDGAAYPSLGGAARIVYRGELGEGGW